MISLNFFFLLYKLYDIICNEFGGLGMNNKKKINPNAGKVVNNIGLKIFVGALAIISFILVAYYVIDVYFVQNQPKCWKSCK